MRFYLDSSAAVKAVLNEEHSDSYRFFLGEYDTEGHEMITSCIGYTEIRRTLLRQEVQPEIATRLLDGIQIIDLTRNVAHIAGTYQNRA